MYASFIHQLAYDTRHMYHALLMQLLSFHGSVHNGGIITDIEDPMSNSSKSQTIIFLGENIDKTNTWLEIFYSFCICNQHFQTKGCTWKDWNMFISTFVRSIHYIWKLCNKRTCKKKTWEIDSSENVLWVFLVD